MEGYDFEGWATVNDVRCSDGRTIRKGAFKHCDGKKVPIVWNHRHNSIEDVLGYGILQHRDEGTYVYGYLNDTKDGNNAKKLLHHGDIESLSIYANELRQDHGDVLHGDIKEVSLVLAGANPKAHIQAVIKHSYDTGEDYESDDEADIYFGETITIAHSDETTEEMENENVDNENTVEPVEETIEHADDETVGSVWDSLSEKQKTAVYAIIMEILNNEGEDDNMTHNVFEKESQRAPVLTHSDMVEIVADAKRCGSLKEAVENYVENNEALQHSVTDANGDTVTYGIANIDYLFPDAQKLSNTPDFINEDTEWVDKVLNGAHHSPFSRIKSVHADITMEDARALGYVKGTQKVEEVFALLKRVTTPTTIYKKQKLDRDDIIDITEMEVVPFLKGEMRMKLNEEIARAALVSDGRVAGTDGKISEDNIRPIWKDNDTYAVRVEVVTPDNGSEQDRAKAFIRAAIKNRKKYKGSGNPTLFTTEDLLTDCLLIEDGTGRLIYDTVEKLKTTLRVKEIVTVPVMEGVTREGGSGESGDNYGLMAIMVNMADYTFGSDKGGNVSMFEDFDIDFNQMKYLIETRCSGCLTKYHSALIFEEEVTLEDDET